MLYNPIEEDNAEVRMWHAPGHSFDGSLRSYAKVTQTRDHTTAINSIDLPLGSKSAGCCCALRLTVWSYSAFDIMPNHSGADQTLIKFLSKSAPLLLRAFLLSLPARELPRYVCCQLLLWCLSFIHICVSRRGLNCSESILASRRAMLI